MRRPRRPLPDRRKPDDHGHDDHAHHRVVEHRVGVERLPALLDVLLVARELRALLVAVRGDGHYFDPPAPRATGLVSPDGSGLEPLPSTRSRPASSFDHGGEVTPSRMTR